MKRTWNFDFYKNRKKYLIISLALAVLTLLGAVLFGVDRDVQFKGGVLLTYSYAGDLGAEDFTAAVRESLGADFSLQQSTDLATGRQNFVLSLTDTSSMDAAAQNGLTAALAEKFPENDLQLVSSNVVDATIGGEFFAKSVTAVAFAAVLMVLYISWRFRRISGWSAGITAVVALLHDLMVVMLAFIWFRFSINANFVAVALTIIGYSLNDTIVVYDRIRENERVLGKKVPVEELVNLSANQSFNRSLMTSVTTCSAMAVVSLVAYFYHVTSILSFSVPMLFGMISGFYSSVCIAPQLWVAWQKRRAEKKK